MAVRHFTRASSEYILVSIGGITAFGPGTAAVIAKKSTDVVGYEFFMGAGIGAGPNNWNLGLNNDTPAFWNGSAEMQAPFTVTAAEGWVLLVMSKATGTVAPRFHKQVLSTGVWTHGNSASTGANSGTPATSMGVGSPATHAGDFFNGHMVAMAMWNTTPANDAAVVALGVDNFADLSALVTGWLATTPRGLWRLDQASTGTAVNDQTANASNQSAISGTSVVTTDEPPFGTTPVNVTPAAVTGTTKVGQTLTADAGTSGTRWTGESSVTGKWQNCATSNGTFVDIASATASTYAAVIGDLTKYIRYLETATGTGGIVTTQASNVVGPVVAAAAFAAVPAHRAAPVLFSVVELT